jgi:hypothetical protein
MNLIGGFGPFLSTVWGIGLVALVAGSVVLDERRRFWLYVIAFAMATATFSWLLGPVLAYRSKGTLFFGSLTAVAMWQLLAPMVSTYLGYLAANPEMPNKTPNVDLTPSHWIGAGYLLIMLLAPSVTLRLLLLAILTAWSLLQHDTHDLKLSFLMFRDALWIWADARDDVREGTWKPAEPRWKRPSMFFLAFFTITITFAISTSYGSAYDAWGNWPNEPERSYDWLLVPASGFLTQGGTYKWCLVQAVILTFSAPLLMVYATILPSIMNIRKWEQSAKEEAATDKRSPLQKLIDKATQEQAP